MSVANLTNVYNKDPGDGIATALLWGTTLTPLNQSTATIGYVPQVQSNGGLTLVAASGLGITWENVLTAGNTSGVNNAIMSAGRTFSFADNTIRINGTVAATSSNGISMGSTANVTEDNDIAIGVLAVTSGTTGNGRRIAIGDGSTAGNTNVAYSIAIGSLASSTGISSICIGRSAITSQQQSICVGLSTSCAALNDVAIGSNAVTSGAGGSGGRVAIGSSCIAGAAGLSFSIAIGANATSNNIGSVSIGRLATAAGDSSVALAISANAATLNDIAIGSACTTTGAGGGHSRVSIGPSANAGTAGTLYNIAIGSQANANTANNSIAIGRLATATHSGSVAIGVSSTTTAANQIMLGNNATGGTTQVYGSVGTTGLLESAGFLVSFNQVRASIRLTAVQLVASGAGITAVTMPTVDYSSDYGSPAITSVASVLNTRANRCMTGYLQHDIVFVGPTVANGYYRIEIGKNTNGVITVLCSINVFVIAGSTTHSACIPFSEYNNTAPAPNVFYFAQCNNPAVFGQDYNIQTTTHFVGQMTN